METTSQVNSNSNITNLSLAHLRYQHLKPHLANKTWDRTPTRQYLVELWLKTWPLVNLTFIIFLCLADNACPSVVISLRQILVEFFRLDKVVIISDEIANFNIQITHWICPINYVQSFKGSGRQDSEKKIILEILEYKLFNIKQASEYRTSPIRLGVPLKWKAGKLGYPLNIPPL